MVNGGWDQFDPFRATTERIRGVVGDEGVGNWMRQTALYRVVMGYYNTLVEFMDARPQVITGHSMGEMASMVQAGLTDELTMARIADKRETIATMPRSSDAQSEAGMFALLGRPQAIDACRAYIESLTGVWDVHEANWNTQSQLVISALKRHFDLAKAKFDELKIKAIPIPGVTDGYHSPLMGSKQELFERELDKIDGGVRFTDPKLSIYSPMQYSLRRDKDRELTPDPVVRSGPNGERVIRKIFTAPVGFSPTVVQMGADVRPRVVFLADPSELLGPIVKSNLERAGLSISDRQETDRPEITAMINLTPDPRSLIAALHRISGVYELDLRIPKLVTA